MNLEGTLGKCVARKLEEIVEHPLKCSDLVFSLVSGNDEIAEEVGKSRVIVKYVYKKRFLKRSHANGEDENGEGLLIQAHKKTLCHVRKTRMSLEIHYTLEYLSGWK